MPPTLCPEQPRPWLGVCVSVHMHTTLCMCRYIFTHGAVGSCLTLSAPGPAQAPVGVGAHPEVFESSPLPPGHAYSSVTRAPCACQVGLRALSLVVPLPVLLAIPACGLAECVGQGASSLSQTQGSEWVFLSFQI